MADAGQETDAAILLAMGEIEALKAKDPNHELLQFAATFASMDPPKAFFERFGDKHLAENIRGTEFGYAAICANYYVALKHAVEEV